MGGGAPVPHFLTDLGGPGLPPHFFPGVPLAAAGFDSLRKRAHVACSDFKLYGPEQGLFGAVCHHVDRSRDPEQNVRV